VPLLVVMTYRPEYTHGWASKPQYEQLRLEALSPTGAAEILEALLGDDASLTSLKRMLADRAGAIPFSWRKARAHSWRQGRWPVCAGRIGVPSP
jgi:hypothetical protein